jgi:hypothetical protein
MYIKMAKRERRIRLIGDAIDILERGQVSFDCEEGKGDY